MNERDKALKVARKSSNENDWRAYRKLRNTRTYEIRSAKSNFRKNLLAENFNNPKTFWDTIKNIMPTKTRKVAHDTSGDTKEKVNSLCEFFSSIAFHLKEKSILLKDFVWTKAKHSLLRTSDSFNFHYVSKIYIEKELRKFKRKKATGVDDLPPGLLRDCAWRRQQSSDVFLCVPY